MKKLFIYYSLTGNGDKVAAELKKQGFEIRKVVSKFRYPKSLFPLMMIGGFRAATGKRDRLQKFDTNLDGYDKIVIGFPVWFDRLSPAANTILSSLDLKGKNLEFVLCSGSGEAGKATDVIKSLYDVAPIILKEPKKNRGELGKVGNLNN